MNVSLLLRWSLLFGCYGVFGRACFLRVKYIVCGRNGMASAQNEQNTDFLNSNNQQKYKIKSPG